MDWERALKLWYNLLSVARKVRQETNHEPNEFMNQAHVLQILTRFYEQKHEHYRIKRLGIFGSVARGEATADSDVDVVIDLSEPDLFKMVGIKLDLEEILHCPVDIVRYRENMNPFLKRRIDREALYVR